MQKLPTNFVDMAHTPEEMKEESQIPAYKPPLYPYGLSICLGNDELEKLNMNVVGVEVGDMMFMDCIAKVTSISQSDTAEGSRSRLEMTITHIALESPEEEVVEGPARKINYGRMYKSE